MCAKEEMQYDEIDLTEIIVRLVRLFQHHYLLLLFSVLLGIGIGFTVATFKPPRYTRFMIVRLDEFTESHFKALFIPFGNILEREKTSVNKKKMSHEFHFELETIKKIVSVNVLDNLGELKAFEGKNYRNSEDKNIFLVEATVSDILVIPKLQTGIIQYLKEDKYIKAYVNHKKKIYKNSILRVEQQINSNNQIRKVLSYENKNFKTPPSIDILTLDIKIQTLEQKKEDLFLKLSFIQGFELIKGFSNYQDPDPINKIRYCTLGGFLGFLLCFIVLVISPSRANSNNNNP